MSDSWALVQTNVVHKTKELLSQSVYLSQWLLAALNNKSRDVFGRYSYSQLSFRAVHRRPSENALHSPVQVL